MCPPAPQGAGFFCNKEWAFCNKVACMTMSHKVCSWIGAILRENLEVVDLAARQRAKFEGWLKFELAAKIEHEAGKSVRIEPVNSISRSRHDLSFLYAGETYYLELKTINTNWRIAGIESRRRPITKNISGVVDDLRKLSGLGRRGISAFVIFPVPREDLRWREYVQRIRDNAGIPTEDGHCEVLSFYSNAVDEYSVVVYTLSAQGQ